MKTGLELQLRCDLATAQVAAGQTAEKATSSSSSSRSSAWGPGRILRILAEPKSDELGEQFVCYKIKHVGFN